MLWIHYFWSTSLKSYNLWVRYSCRMSIVLALGWGTLLAQTRPVGSNVCAVALNPVDNKRVAIRGFVDLSPNPHGPMIIDATCSVGSKLPEANERWGRVLIEIEDPYVRSGPMSRLRELIDRRTKIYGQVNVEGYLTCRLIHRTSNSAVGHGFGPWRLIPCRIRVVNVTSISEVY